MTMRELKPCPFCGQKPKSYSITITDGKVSEMELECCMKFIIRPNIFYYTVAFEEHTFYPDGDAIEVWNRRADNVQDQNSDC